MMMVVVVVSGSGAGSEPDEVEEEDEERDDEILWMGWDQRRRGGREDLLFVFLAVKDLSKPESPRLFRNTKTGRALS